MIQNKVIITGLKFPEGPIFDRKGNLWFVEIEGGNISCWNRKSVSRFDVDGTPNGLAIDRNGIIWFCDSAKGAIRTFNPKTRIIETVCSQTIDGRKLIRPNDLIFDIDGNLLFSDHADGRKEPLSTLCVLPKGKNIAIVISKNKLFTNGLAFMSDNKTLIFAETYKQQLWICEWDEESMKIQNERIFAKLGVGPWGPDGIAIDESDNLFVAVFNEGIVCRLAKNGQIIDSLICEGSRPTSCAFDSFGDLGLIVTEAELGEIISYPYLKNGLILYHLIS